METIKLSLNMQLGLKNILIQLKVKFIKMDLNKHPGTDQGSSYLYREIESVCLSQSSNQVVQ